MYSWIISDDHPMHMHIYRIMKATYHIFDPSNEPSSAYETNNTATLGYTISQEEPRVSGIFIHFRLYQETDMRFTVVLRDITEDDMLFQIEDKVQGVCIPAPQELLLGMLEVEEFIFAMWMKNSGHCAPSSHKMERAIACLIWKHVQVMKYHLRVLPQETIVKKGVDLGLAKCFICNSDLLHCDSCKIVSCKSQECRGYSKPPLAQCAGHRKALCVPCLEDQGPNRWLEKCRACESWCSMEDLSVTLCTGCPVTSMPLAPGSKSGGFCMNCKLFGWRTCNNPQCSTGKICPECASNGVACLCQKVWVCDHCAEHDHFIMRCPRCDRPFCPSCCYIDRCAGCERESLCNDCAAEAPDADDEALGRMPVILISSCTRCDAKLCESCGTTCWSCRHVG
ncbi:hypothetical protein K503DRAFT_408783 [Rhizopogon vinicolor AM-OR11-026]|uniref:Uncharacterized protein n=1 Tax=Rhizopogon vinicolor AM-OR11-026 TaxID=1314800 RepID=A0A1B7NB51_9AGAM|nr:hypothetical protein K503DRAFT_408783 [Rhizopogon vinicolor AM-OR11-026]